MKPLPRVREDEGRRERKREEERAETRVLKPKFHQPEAEPEREGHQAAGSRATSFLTRSQPEPCPAWSKSHICNNKI